MHLFYLNHPDLTWIIYALLFFLVFHSGYDDDKDKPKTWSIIVLCIIALLFWDFIDSLIFFPNSVFLFFGFIVLNILVRGHYQDNNSIKLKQWSIIALFIVGFLFVMYSQEKYATNMINADRIMRGMTTQERKEYIQDLEELNDY